MSLAARLPKRAHGNQHGRSVRHLQVLVVTAEEDDALRVQDLEGKEQSTDLHD